MATLTVVCPDCKTKNLPGRLHCLGCGIDLTALQPTEEEIRLAQASPPQPTRLPDGSTLGETVFGWFKLYCGVTLFIDVIVLILLFSGALTPQPDPIGPFVRSSAPPSMAEALAEIDRQKAAEATSALILILVILIPLMLMTAYSAFAAPSPGTWSLGAVVLCLGLGGCSLPVAVLLLINWFKPEVQAHFGRAETT